MNHALTNTKREKRLDMLQLAILEKPFGIKLVGFGEIPGILMHAIDIDHDLEVLGNRVTAQRGRLQRLIGNTGERGRDYAEDLQCAVFV